MTPITGPGHLFPGSTAVKLSDPFNPVRESDSKIVEITRSVPAAFIYSEPSLIKQVTLKSTSAPAYLSGQMSDQVDRERTSEAVKDLSLNLSRFLEDGETSVSQSATQYRYSTLSEHPSSIDEDSFVVDHKETSAELNFNLKTKSGANLKFTLRLESGYGHDEVESGVAFQTLSVDFELDGSLSRREREELVSFSQGLNKLANDYLGGTRPRLSDLNLADLSSVSELQLSMDDGFRRDFSLKMVDTDQQRQIEAVVWGDEVTMSIDNQRLIGASSAEGRQAALAHYRQMLIDGAQRGEAKSSQKKMLLDAFDSLFGQIQAKHYQLELSAEESMMLTGLPDFSLHFEGDIAVQNPHPQRSSQIEKFSLKLAQETRLLEDETVDRKVEQRQLWELESSYFRPLINWKDVDFDNQNYQYFELSERAETRSLTGLIDGEPYGSQSRVFESRFDAQEYRMGELVDWNTEIHNLDEVLDFTARLRNLDDQNNRVELEELLQDPVEMSKRASVEYIDQDESAVPKVSVPQDMKPQLYSD